MNLKDLSHSIHSDIPSWENCTVFEINRITEEINSESFAIDDVKMQCGIGTHVDAPSHCCKNGTSIDELDVSKLLSECVLIDVSDKAHEGYIFSKTDLMEFELSYGPIEPHSLVIVNFGWWKLWETPSKYRNNLLFPCISREAAELLVNRNITGLGVDTLSPDGPNLDFLVHKIILNSGAYIIENLTNLDNIPPKKSHILVAPMKIKNGSESPARVFSIIHEPINPKSDVS